MRREWRCAVAAAGLPTMTQRHRAPLERNHYPANGVGGDTITFGKDLTMHVHGTKSSSQGNRPQRVVANVALLAFAAACVPMVSGWLIVAALAVGIDS